MRIDLHTHSAASDGTDTPAALVRAAAASGLDVVAVTDHDTTAGWSEAVAACPPGLTVVPGVEFSCVHEPSGGRRISLHVLGYCLDPDDAALRAERRRLRAGRRDRARTMVNRLAAAGYPISWAAVSEHAGDAPVGRPHIARALVSAGAASDVPAAFAGPLSWRAGFYVRKPDTPVLDAIRMIRAAGGLPVFAHPIARRRGPVVDDSVVADMAAAGLVGIEVDHPDHDAEDRRHAARLAADLDLVPTGSSDYHGDNKPNRLGQCLTGPDAYERLLALPHATEPVRG